MAPRTQPADASRDGLRVLYADDRRYAPVRVLGEGHTARVLLATDPSGDQVAIKAMKDEQSLSPRAFMEEADRLQALRRKERELFPDRPDSQSAFPTVLDRDPDERFFVMEVAPGRPLARLFSNRQIVRPEQAVSITIRIGEALRVAGALGLRAQDLKSDAIFWDHVSGRVVILDWNVVADSRLPETGWLPADLRTTASYLDALLAGGETVTEWSGRIYDPPARWSRYYRALRLSLEDLVAHPEGAHLEEFLSTLMAVEAMLGDQPENLLDFVRACLLDARESDDDDRNALADQAAAAAEIALTTRTLALTLDARGLLGQAEDLAGPEGQVIGRLWQCVKTADEAGGFDVGKSLEIYRLRALASVARRAPGYAGDALEIARKLARLEWDEAARRIGGLRGQLAEHPAISSLLQDLEHESKGLRDGRAGLAALDAGDREKARALLASGLAELSKVRYQDKLLERFPMLREQLAALPAPAARKTEVDQTELAVAAARRRFARQGRLSVEGLAETGDERVAALQRLGKAWDETDTPGADTRPPVTDVMPALLHAMEVSAKQRGCFPLNRAEKIFDRIIENLDARLDTTDRADADRVRSDADALGDHCRQISDALRDTDLDRGWATEAVDALKTWRRRFRERTERASETHQTLSLYVRGIEKLGSETGLAGRAELLTRLQRRRPEDPTVARLMRELRVEVDDAEQTRPDDAEVQTARRVLDPHLAPAAAAAATTPVAPAPAARPAGISDAKTIPNRLPASMVAPPPPRASEADRPTAAAPQVGRPPPSKAVWIGASALVVIAVIIAFVALRPPVNPGDGPTPDGPETAGQQTAGQQTAGQQAAGQQAAGQQTAGQQAAGQQAAGQPSEKTAAEKAAIAAAEKAAAERAAAEKAEAEKAAAAQAAAEKAAADKAAAEKAAAEKAAAQKAAAQRAARTTPRRTTPTKRYESEDAKLRRMAEERAKKLREQLAREKAAREKAAQNAPERRPPPKPDDDKPEARPKTPKPDDGKKPSYLTDDW